MNEWRANVFNHVAVAEAGGRYDALNLNTDGGGLSAWIMQWQELSGDLGKVLGEMARLEPNALAEALGSGWRDVVTSTKTAGIRPVGGFLLADSNGPWPTRFRAAGRSIPLQAVQRLVAVTGLHWTQAEKAAHILGTYTERGMAMCFDTAINQGPYGVVDAAQNTMRSIDPNMVVGRDRLRAFAAWAMAYRKLTSPPTKPHPRAPKQTWKAVGQEWHVFLGSTDLWRVGMDRKQRILDASDLADGALEVVG